MPLELDNDFCSPCEPIARIWGHEENHIRRRPIVVVDVHLPEIQTISLFGGYLPVPLTVSAA